MSLVYRNILAAVMAAGMLMTLSAPAANAQDAAAPAAEAPAAADGAAPVAATPETLDPLLAGADIDRGREVFAKVGVCVSCHGWDGDGTGKNPRSEGQAALLRESHQDAAGFIEIISCGIPGTPMPYHDSASYKDDRCYGQTLDQFPEGQAPRKGKSIRHEDIINLVAYIQTHIQGKPKATYEDCADYFGASAEKACAWMKQ